MAKTNEEIVKSYKERIRRQNKAIQDNYDRVSAAVPKGTVDRIKALGMTINGAINDSLIAYLECLEESQVEGAHTAEIRQEKEGREEILKESSKSQNKPNKDAWDGLTEEEKTAELQAMLEAKRKEASAKKEVEKANEDHAIKNTTTESIEKSEEVDELDDKLKHLKSYRRQAIEEREKYGEIPLDRIKWLVSEAEKEGFDILSEDFQSWLLDSFGELNVESINAYLEDIGKKTN